MTPELLIAWLMGLVTGVGGALLAHRIADQLRALSSPQSEHSHHTTLDASTPGSPPPASAGPRSEPFLEDESMCHQGADGTRAQAAGRPPQICDEGVVTVPGRAGALSSPARPAAVLTMDGALERFCADLGYRS